MELLAAFAGAVLGFLGAARLQNKIDNRAQKQQLAAAVAEALAAASNLQFAIVACRHQWADWRGRLPLAAATATELLFSQPTAWRTGMASALRSLSQRNYEETRTVHALLMVPLARATTALVHVSMTEETGVREASHALADAIGEVMANFGSDRGWTRATRNLDDAVARLRKESDSALADRERSVLRPSTWRPTFIQHAARRQRSTTANEDKRPT